jgi:GNAT superfamily N-acetyltransferase
VHKPSGEFAGYTQIKTQDLQPDLAWQWETGVDPAHRNKGLGRWLKAAMIERIISEYPAVERVDTFNAGSNEPMLNINIAMGFEPIHLSHAWQGDLATARERLRA